MQPACSKLLVGCLLLTCGSSLHAEEVPKPLPALEALLYKGVIGVALDAVPMDPQARVTLQRANAVASGTASGRALSVWVGWTNPILLIGGLLWGVLAASNIQAEETAVQTGTSLPPEPKGAAPTPTPAQAAVASADGRAPAAASAFATATASVPVAASR
jgi:hypothetical protein